MDPRVALVALLVASSTALAATPYATPLNVGIDNPNGRDVEYARDEVVIWTPDHPTTSLRLVATDRLNAEPYLQVCVVLLGYCREHASGRGEVVVEAIPGAPWPANTQVFVWIYSGRVFLSGEVSLATWGGLQAQFTPGVTTREIVPYLAAGQGGTPDLRAALGEAPPCGTSVRGAACGTIPFQATRVTVQVVDHHREDPVVFRVCITLDGAELACMNGTGERTLAGNFPAGSTVDVRPHMIVGSKITATKGYALLTYA